jgi:hypothetical protein
MDPTKTTGMKPGAHDGHKVKTDVTFPFLTSILREFARIIRIIEMSVTNQ